ncbi:MAG: hypothetical protein AABY15_05500 [Nanoarchaeota archaeon]
MADIKGGHKVLEPSAGIGLLAEGILRHNSNIVLDCIELNSECKKELRKKGFNVIWSDFLDFKPKYLYDRVIGAPNFKDNIDCAHVMKMYECIKPGGKVISIMSPYWMTQDSKLQIKFREWLNDKSYVITMLPDNSYMEDGITVPTILITIEK